MSEKNLEERQSEKKILDRESSPLMTVQFVQQKYERSSFEKQQNPNLEKSLDQSLIQSDLLINNYSFNETKMIFEQSENQFHFETSWPSINQNLFQRSGSFQNDKSSETELVKNSLLRVNIGKDDLSNSLLITKKIFGQQLLQNHSMEKEKIEKPSENDSNIQKQKKTEQVPLDRVQNTLIKETQNLQSIKNVKEKSDEVGIVLNNQIMSQQNYSTVLKSYLFQENKEIKKEEDNLEESLDNSVMPEVINKNNEQLSNQKSREQDLRKQDSNIQRLDWSQALKNRVFLQTEQKNIRKNSQKHKQISVHNNQIAQIKNNSINQSINQSIFDASEKIDIISSMRQDANLSKQKLSINKLNEDVNIKEILDQLNYFDEDGDEDQYQENKQNESIQKGIFLKDISTISIKISKQEQQDIIQKVQMLLEISSESFLNKDYQTVIDSLNPLKKEIQQKIGKFNLPYCKLIDRLGIAYLFNNDSEKDGTSYLLESGELIKQIIKETEGEAKEEAKRQMQKMTALRNLWMNIWIINKPSFLLKDEDQSYIFYLQKSLEIFRKYDGLKRETKICEQLISQIKSGNKKERKNSDFYSKIKAAHRQARMDLGSLAALKSAHQALELCKHHFGDPMIKHESYQLLGQIYQIRGDYQQGLSYRKEDMKFCQQMLRKSDSKINFCFAECYMSLGRSYHQLGKLEKAQKYYNQAQKFSEKYKIDHIGLIPFHHNINYNLGTLKVSLGLYDQAIKYFDNCLKSQYLIKTPQAGVFFFKAVILSEKASCLLHLNRQIEARRCFQASFDLYESYPGKVSIHYARTLQLYSQMQSCSGNKNEALKSAKLSLIILQHFYKPEHPDVIKSKCLLQEIRKAIIDDYQKTDNSQSNIITESFVEHCQIKQNMNQQPDIQKRGDHINQEALQIIESASQLRKKANIQFYQKCYQEVEENFQLARAVLDSSNLLGSLEYAELLYDQSQFILQSDHQDKLTQALRKAKESEKIMEKNLSPKRLQLIKIKVYACMLAIKRKKKLNQQPKLAIREIIQKHNSEFISQNDKKKNNHLISNAIPNTFKSQFPLLNLLLNKPSNEQDYIQAASFLRQKGDNFIKEGNLQLAQSSYNEALKIFLLKNPSNKIQLANLYHSFSRLFFTQGLLAKALAMAQIQLQIEIETASPSVAKTKHWIEEIQKYVMSKKIQFTDAQNKYSFQNGSKSHEKQKIIKPESYGKINEIKNYPKEKKQPSNELYFLQKTRALNKQANLLFYQEKYQQAQKVYRKAINLYISNNMPIHIEYTDLLFDLSQFYLKLERNQEAYDTVSTILDILSSKFDPTHPKIERAKQMILIIKKIIEKENQLKQRDSPQKIKQKNDEEKAVELTEMANASRLLKNNDEAENFYFLAQNIFESCKIGDRVSCGRLYYFWASFQLERGGDLQYAEGLAQNAVQILKKKLNTSDKNLIEAKKLAQKIKEMLEG